MRQTRGQYSRKRMSCLTTYCTDAEFDQELGDEIKILERMRASITGNGDVDEYWKDNIGDDIAISKKLL